MCFSKLIATHRALGPRGSWHYPWKWTKWNVSPSIGSHGQLVFPQIRWECDAGFVQTWLAEDGFVFTQETEKLRELNLQAEQEKVNAVAQVRNEAKAEIVKMRDKIQEVSQGCEEVISRKQESAVQWKNACFCECLNSLWRIPTNCLGDRCE